jgi:hypothetical protein
LIFTSLHQDSLGTARRTPFGLFDSSLISAQQIETATARMMKNIREKMKKNAFLSDVVDLQQKD